MIFKHRLVLFFYCFTYLVYVIDAIPCMLLILINIDSDGEFCKIHGLALNNHLKEDKEQHKPCVSFGKNCYYCFIFLGCGRTLQESIDEFSHTPSNGKEEICQWRISATHGEKIILNITALDIPETSSCETDYLEVRDGYYVKSEILGK